MLPPLLPLARRRHRAHPAPAPAAEAADSAGTQDLELGEKELGGEPVALRLVKFSRVNCLTIFVESNQGDEETTVVTKLVLLGSGGDTFEVKDIKDVSKEHDHS